MVLASEEYLKATGAAGAAGVTAAAAWAELAEEGIRDADVHTWAGGAAKTDSIAVAGLLESDVILVNISAQGASSPTSVIGVNDHANDQIDLLLDQNGQDVVTKISYLVLIPSSL